MKKITEKQIKEIIISEAKNIKEKEKIYNEIKKLNENLIILNEAVPSALGSYGFKTEEDVMNKTSKTGFVNDKNKIASNISKLAEEMEEMEEEDIDSKKLKELEEELNKLKEKLKK